MKIDELPEYVEHFRERVLQDALAQATASYWHKRAEAFEAAAPRPCDFTGRATEEELEFRRRAMATAAQACRQKAALMLGGDGDG